MTQLFSFQPSAQAPFQFQPTLDGQVYSVVVTWNLFGRRYYANCYQLDGTLVFCVAMVGSPTGVGIQSVAWSNGSVIVTTAVPHGYRIGDTVKLTISGCEPASLNGVHDCLIASPVTFSYPLATDPGGFTQLGTASYDVSLAAGYFASTMVFRESSQAFEVNP